MELRAAWPFIITPQRGMCQCHNVGLYTAWTFIAKPRHRDGTQHGHLSSRHNAGYNHTIPMELRHHSPLLSHHNVEGEHTILMGLHHHQPFIITPQRGV